MFAYFKNFGFEKPTEIQENYCSDQNDFSILLANTGSGKTLAYLIKLALFLEKNPNEQILILSPTRELAIQIYVVLKKLKLPYNNILCYGGHSFKNERLQFTQKPKIIVATPGRILDHYKTETEGLNKFSALIIDEYDKTLEFGFLNELEAIYSYSKNLSHIQLISATPISELPTFLQNTPFKIFNFLEKKKPSLTYFSVEAEENDKLKALALFLTTIKNETSIIFCTHREATERISKQLTEYGKANQVFHGGLDQLDREKALIKFTNGTIDCLIATDLASRGLDIRDIQNIIHYQFPKSLEDFIHRNGRTARMNQSGKIYLIHSENEPLPNYLQTFTIKPFKLAKNFVDYTQPKFITLYINIGRKQKIRKMDIVGYFTTELKIPFDKLGLINIKDTYTYLAIDCITYLKIKQKITIPVKIKKTNAKINFCR